MSVSTLDQNTQVAGTLIDRLRREVFAQPGKVAALLGLLIVAIVLWGPRLSQYLRRPTGDNFLTNNNGSTALPASLNTVGMESVARGENSSPVNAEQISRLITELTELMRQRVNADLDIFSQLEDPFRPPEVVDPEGKSPLIATTQPASSNVGDSPGGLSSVKKTASEWAATIKVRAIVVGSDFRAAIVDDQVCLLEPGTTPPTIRVQLPEGEQQFRVTAIDPEGVVLQNGDEFVRVAPIERAGRVKISAGRLRRSTSSSSDAL